MVIIWINSWTIRKKESASFITTYFQKPLRFYIKFHFTSPLTMMPVLSLITQSMTAIRIGVAASHSTRKIVCGHKIKGKYLVWEKTIWIEPGLWVLFKNQLNVRVFHLSPDTAIIRSSKVVKKPRYISVRHTTIWKMTII